ncbi:Glyoxalase/Bleomycin resistance protein/Dioxygenase superfamily protein [Parafrankia irregularis]|uniref:Glyoxalase/Bleomycin resistance protein/Dioxygenase superfamily protein n=1 Tax=Parafrankia irregularis TaxID=795642 RepID=A0A0S4QIU1_9ACTN|nr:MULTISPECIES: VOC family protein [Parafrankia]MBE3200888.1 VOC family protein [Parafrankia sp. CH37]CUU54716.1 Glyoxalase/Bleomycin resistance protein/Dioxygenase superfamily protein [Parafrankia irregularis]
MTILRIERAVYAVDDLPTCTRFFQDFGLTLSAAHDDADKDENEDRAVFTTLSNQAVELRRSDDPSLPPPVEPGPTIREVVWGVDTQENLDQLVRDLRTDHEVRVDAAGVAHLFDETGFGLGLAVAAPAEPPAVEIPVNRFGAVGRWNRGLDPFAPVRPLRLCHVALNIPKNGWQKAVAFYTDRLGFRITDQVLPMGTFMRCEGDFDQHTLLLCHRPDRAGINHTSYEVNSFDDVILGGNQMIEAGWREARRLGRHTVGSNVFRFVHAPCGGRVEYAADMDRVDDSYAPRTHEVTPPHHLWTLQTNRESAQ